MSIFDNTMKKCKVKISDNIFSQGELFPLKHIIAEITTWKRSLCLQQYINFW